MSQASHQSQGYNSRISYLIPNGVDIDEYFLNPVAGARMRAQLGVPQSSPVVGLVARYHPDKDIDTFLNAAALAVRERPNIRFVLCGSGLDHANPELVNCVRANGLLEHVQLLGVRSDLPNVLSAVNVATLSSVSESFPNVLLEAMACGIPCVSTDVGEASQIIGDTGVIVPSGNPAGLAKAWLSLIDNERLDAFGSAAAARVREQFSMDRCVQRYLALYASVTETCKQTGNPA